MSNPGLDDPDYARFAWGRFRRLILWMALASSLAAGAGLTALRLLIGPVPLHMGIATGLGTFFSVMLAATLMGLVFLSNGTGHDDTIVDPFEDLNP